MTPEQAQVLAALPLQVLLLLGLAKVYVDGRADRKELLARVDKLIDDNERMRDRLLIIEYKLGVAAPPAPPPDK